MFCIEQRNISYEKTLSSRSLLFWVYTEVKVLQNVNNLHIKRNAPAREHMSVFVLVCRAMFQVFWELFTFLKFRGSVNRDCKNEVTTSWKFVESGTYLHVYLWSLRFCLFHLWCSSVSVLYWSISTWSCIQERQSIVIVVTVYGVAVGDVW